MSAMDPIEISLTVISVSLMIFVVVETVFFVFFRGRRRTDRPSRENGLRPQDLHSKTSDHVPKWRLYFLCWNRKPKHHCNLVSSVGEGEDNCSYTEQTTVVTTLGALQASPFQSDLVTKLFPAQGENDLWQLQALFGPSRLLFTINEESMEDLASVDTRSTRSRRPSRGSHEFLPSVSPITSPPFSDSPPASSNRELSPAPAIRPFIDESSWSASSASSCEAMVPPSPPRKALKILLEETLFSPISPPLPVTALTTSPSKIVHNPHFGRTTLGSLFESSPPSSGLSNLNRVYPLVSPKRERQYTADSLLSGSARAHIEGIPILSSSFSDTHFSRGLHPFRSYSPPWQNSPPDSLSTLSPPSSPLRFMGRSSPYRISSSVYSSNASNPAVEATRAGSFSRIIEEIC